MPQCQALHTCCSGYLIATVSGIRQYDIMLLCHITLFFLYDINILLVEVELVVLHQLFYNSFALK